jgi:hypothetical protein
MELSPEVARYVVRFHWDLMSGEERLAQRHLAATIKAAGGSDLAAQGQARKSLSRLDVAIRTVSKNEKGITPLQFLSDDPSVLGLTADGFEAFELRTTARILRERAAEVRFNLCPRCDKLARTPTAKQCRHCGYDWHAA